MAEFGRSYVENTKRQRLESIIKLNPRTKKQGIVLTGDSITEQFPIYEMYRGNKPIYNRGIGGYTTIELLQQLKELVFELEPEKVFLLIGTNDLVVDNNHERIIQRIEEICVKIKDKLPDTKIYLISIYPINRSSDPKVVPFIIDSRTNDEIQSLNKSIPKLAEKLNIPYIDIYSYLTDETGNLKIEYTIDGIHMSVNGYEVVISMLEKYFE